MKLIEGKTYKRKGWKSEDRWWDRLVCMVSFDEKTVLYSQRFDCDFDMITTQKCSVAHFKRIMNYKEPIEETP